MKNIIIFISIVLFFYSNSFGQKNNEVVSGKVSFITLKNVYVTFENTKLLKIGDTLRLSEQNKSCLLIQNISSKSVMCVAILNCKVIKGDIVYYNFIPKIEEPQIENKIVAPVVSKSLEASDTLPNDKTDKLYIAKTRARLSMTSYSNLSSNNDNKHKLVYRFSMDAKHINNSKVSFESYLNYRQYLKSDDNSNNFDIYNLALSYDVNPTLLVSFGRKINTKTASLGAIDGLQAEKYFGNNYIGVIAGFRPDINDYQFNSNLFEYGAYIGKTTTKPKLYSVTTLGVLQQNNKGEIDRRYAYFQHSSTLFKKLNLFSSLEMDLYNKTDSISKNSIDLTNLYVSAKYKFSSKFNLMLSYDSRKKIIYYETFKTEIERLLDDNEARQGVRLRLNIRPARFIFTGFSYSQRFQSSTQNKSDNINGYITFSKIPTIGGRLSINYNKNSSNYLESNVISIRHSRNLIVNKLSADFYFRTVNYEYVSSATSIKQNYYGANLSYNLTKGLRFNVFGELSVDPKSDNDFRLNMALIKRFKNKK